MLDVYKPNSLKRAQLFSRILEMLIRFWLHQQMSDSIILVFHDMVRKLKNLLERFW